MVKCLGIELSIKDIGEFRNFLEPLAKTIEQIEISNFEDENGMRLKNNTQYIKLKESIYKFKIK